MRGRRWVRGAVARLRPRGSDQISDPWSAYLRGVEPGLSAAPRVHRFAQVPVLGDPAATAVPLTVWVEGDAADVDRVRDELSASSTIAPAAVIGGPLTDALSTAGHDHLLLLCAGTQLAPLALQRLGQAARLAPDAAVITCDLDALDADGARRDPRLSPGPSPDRWLACDDSGAALLVARTAAATQAAALTPAPGWRHELALALAGPGGEAHAHVPMLLSHLRAGGALEVPAVGAEVVTRILRRSEPQAAVRSVGDGLRRVERPIVGEPSVELIVCFRDRAALTARCVDSVLHHTGWANLRIALVDNGSVEPETAELLTRLSADERIRVLRDESPFNFAALNNRAAASSTADVLVFLNNDTEAVEEGWLQALLQEAQRPQVGAVAPLLLYEDGLVQHAGAALGLHGYAGHPFAGLAPGRPTPFGHAAQGTRNWLAVSAACTMVERAKFEAVDGFDETFVVAGNDVDLCLRLTAAGHRSLCVPWSQLVHAESRSRGAHIDPADFAASERSYGAYRTVGDPFYNPNLTLQRTDCGVRTPGEGGR